MQVDYVKQSEIEAVANGLLSKCGLPDDGYIDVENILECELGICLETFDASLLPQQIRDDVLGYIDFTANTVAVHDSLLPENNPDNIGRFNFTLAHEIGHYSLHKDAFMATINQPTCFDMRKEYLMTKQKNGMAKKPDVEWQADCFAASLLMPCNLVREHWYDLTGSYDAIAHCEIAEQFPLHVQTAYNQNALASMFVKNMAQNMRVSAQALSIRLQSISLITEHKKQYALL